jgi:tetratricopeptide (TPR) repeat protein
MKRYKFYIALCFVLVFSFYNYTYSQQDNFSKGFEAYQQGDYPQAIEFYTAHLEKNFSVNALFNRGLAYYDSELYSKAIEDYNNVILLDSLDFEAYYNHGLAYYKIGDCAAANLDFNKTIEISPDYANAYTSIGLCLMDYNKYNEALDYFNQALKIEPNSANAYYNRALANKALINHENAEVDFRMAVKLNPTAIYYWGLGEFYYETDKYNKSVEAYTKAIEINPVEGNLYYNRGISLYSQKSYKEAIADFEQTLKFMPNNIDVLWYLALSYKNNGDNEMALYYYNRVESINPNYEYLWGINKSEIVLKQKIAKNFAYILALVVLVVIAIVLLLKIIFRKEEEVRRN